MKAYFKAFFSLRNDWEDLSNQQVGRLFRACLEYGANGTIPNLDDDETVKVAWKTQKRLIDEAATVYDDISQKRSKAANARWRRERESREHQEQKHPFVLKTKTKTKTNSYPYNPFSNEYTNEALECLEVDLNAGGMRQEDD